MRQLWKNSYDTIDCTTMHHNVFESVKTKLRGAETKTTKEKTKSFLQHKNMSKHRSKQKESMDTRNCFTIITIRDNTMAYVLMQYCERSDFNRVVYTSKSTFDCNVSEEETRLNLDLFQEKH